MKRLVICVLAVFVMISCENDARKEQEQARQRAIEANLKTVADLDKALNRDEFDYVIKHSKEYLKQYPDSDKIWNLIGWAYAKSGNLDKAVESFEKAISKNKSSDNSYVGLGMIQRKKGNNKKARECYAEAIRISPDNPEALSSLLVIELLEGKYAEAVKHGEKAWALNKVLASIPANLCIAYHYHGNKTKRDYYYKKAKELNYSRMAGIDNIISGRTHIGPPKKAPGVK